MVSLLPCSKYSSDFLTANFSTGMDFPAILCLSLGTCLEDIYQAVRQMAAMISSWQIITDRPVVLSEGDGFLNFFTWLMMLMMDSKGLKLTHDFNMSLTQD